MVESDDFRSEGMSLVCVAFDDYGMSHRCPTVQAGHDDSLKGDGLKYGEFKIGPLRNVASQTSERLMLRLAVLNRQWWMACLTHR